VKNLMAEGVAAERVFLVGNCMIDTLLRFRSKASASPVLAELGLESRGYALATLHRPSNVDDPARLRDLLGTLERLSERLPVVFPVHPRTRARMEAEGIAARGVAPVPPQGYLSFLRLMSESRLVLTDSGGVQEETTVLQVPCLTLRENTERPITIEQGTNQLVGLAPARILAAADAALSAVPGPARIPDLWDGRASARIAGIVEERAER
jgi:UDP-N-acetylglucosamine 2-epimerase (non-hydrolysing)